MATGASRTIAALALLGGCRPIGAVQPHPVPRVDRDVPDEEAATGDGGDASGDAGGDGPAAGDTPGDGLTGGDTAGGDMVLPPVRFVLECEAGARVGAFDPVSDPSASGGAYLTTANGTAPFIWSATAPALPPNRVEFLLQVPRDTTLYLRVRMAAAANTSDAFYAGFAVGDLRRFFMPTSYFFDLSWVWVSFEQDTARLQFNVAAGSRTMVVGAADPEARCDQLLLTSDPAELALP